MTTKKAIIRIVIGIIIIAIVFAIIDYTFKNIKFLNDNSGALSLIFSAVVAIATTFYVLLTWKLVSINEELRNPNIIVDFQPSSKWINFVHVIIKNIGKEPAYNVKFDINPDFEYSEGKYLSKLNFMKGIKYLSPEREVKSFLMSMAEKNEGKMKPFDIKVQFENKKGKKLEAIYGFDFSQWLGISQLGDDPMEVISKAIKGINEKFDKIINKTIGTKIQTEIFTQEDIKKIKEKQKKENEEFLKRQKILKERIEKKKKNQVKKGK